MTAGHGLANARVSARSHLGAHAPSFMMSPPFGGLGAHEVSPPHADSRHLRFLDWGLPKTATWIA